MKATAALALLAVLALALAAPAAAPRATGHRAPSASRPAGSQSAAPRRTLSGARSRPVATPVGPSPIAGADMVIFVLVAVVVVGCGAALFATPRE